LYYRNAVNIHSKHLIVLQHFERITALDPTVSAGITNMAISLLALGRREEVRCYLSLSICLSVVEGEDGHCCRRCNCWIKH
jgi:hypothetical protein